MSSYRFLRTWVYASILFAGIVSLFNYSADPYMVFGTRWFDSFITNRPAASSRARLFKPYQVERVNPETIIVGNSRPELGLNPLSECWPKMYLPVYSLTFPGSGIIYQMKMLRDSINRTRVKHVFLAIDFRNFLIELDSQHLTDNKKANAIEKDAIRPNGLWEILQGNKYRDYMKSLFSIDAFFDSLNTVLMQKTTSATRTRQGFNPGNNYIDIIRNEGQWVLFEQKTKEIERLFVSGKYVLPDLSKNKSPQLRALLDMIERMRRKGIDLHIFLNPYHKVYLDIIRKTGYWPMLESFKVQFKDILREKGYRNVQLWDFTIYSAYNSEVVPIKGASNRSLNWFWEPAHYRKELGDLMIQLMTGKNCTNEKNISSLGVKIF